LYFDKPIEFYRVVILEYNYKILKEVDMASSQLTTLIEIARDKLNELQEELAFLTGLAKDPPVLPEGYLVSRVVEQGVGYYSTDLPELWLDAFVVVPAEFGDELYAWQDTWDGPWQLKRKFTDGEAFTPEYAWCFSPEEAVAAFLNFRRSMQPAV
jgi:hypothetical protein